MLLVDDWGDLVVRSMQLLCPRRVARMRMLRRVMGIVHCEGMQSATTMMVVMEWMTVSWC